MDASTAESLLKHAEQASAGLRGLDSKAVLARLDDNYGELLEAIESFIDRGRGSEACRLANALTPFWMATKRLDEGSLWLDRVLGVTGADADAHGRALFSAGYLAFWKGDDSRSAALQNRAVDLGRELGLQSVVALALVGLARIALRTNVGEAQRLCREALAATEGTADTIGRSHAMHVLAVAAQMSGNLGEARELMRRRITLAREAGNFAVISSEAGNLSMVERQLGNLDEADALAREALEIDRRRGDGMAIPWKVNGLAAVAAARGDFVRAARLIGIADQAMAAAGGAWPPDEWQHYEQTVARTRDALGDEQFDRLCAAGRSIPVDDAVDLALRTASDPAAD